MPAHLLRESGQAVGGLWTHFSDAAQRVMVYTTQDYIDILKSLLVDWNIDKMSELNDQAEKARNYLMALPQRLERASERIKVPDKEYAFKWIAM